VRLVDWIGWSVVDSPLVSRCRRVSLKTGRNDVGHRGADGETTTGPQKGRERERGERMRSIRRNLRRWFRETETAVRDA